MRRPVVGVIGNAHRIENRFTVQAVGERNLRAVAEVSGAIPLMFAGTPEITDVGALLDVVDGVVLTGARANVHPTRFKTEPHEKHEPYDIHRDDVALALSEACVARGIPHVRHLPRPAGDERRLRRLAASRRSANCPGASTTACRDWRTARSIPTRR